MICLLQPINKNDEGGNGPASPMPKAGEVTQEQASPTKGTPNVSTISTGSEAEEQSSSASAARSKLRKSITAIFGAEVEVSLKTIADSGKILDYYEKSRLRVGIIIHTTQTSHRALAALASPASSCKVTALAVLKPPPSFSMGNLTEEQQPHLTPGSIMQKWMIDNNLGNHSESVAVLGGEEGARQIVQRDDVDAVFIIVPDEIHREYAKSALEGEKHVLLNDPVSTSLQSFKEQLAYARRYGKFVQSSTAFVHQYRVRQFMECVLREEQFGRVTTMDAHLSVCSKDLALVGVTMPLRKNEGCIRRLGRYCVLFSLLLYQKLGSHPIAVQVHSATLQQYNGNNNNNMNNDGDNNNESNETKQEARELIKAKCSIKYSENRVCNMAVGYSSASTTRQRVEVKTDTNMATMSDFVFPHPDGLANYRIYEDAKKGNIKSDMEVMHGEAIDMAGGPSHDVVMWRSFAELCRSVDETGWQDDSLLRERVREAIEITIQTKTILNALIKSFEEGCVEVQL